MPSFTWSVSDGREPRWMLHPWAMLSALWKRPHPSSHPRTCSVAPVQQPTPCLEQGLGSGGGDQVLVSPLRDLPVRPPHRGPVL